MDTAFNDQPETLRDKFATSALIALLSHVPAHIPFSTSSDKQPEGDAHEKVANEAYRWADAMLKARTVEK